MSIGSDSRTVLLVEDDELLRESMEFDLRRIGAQVRIAESGSTAMMILLSEKIDLVISDMHMPDGNGIQLFNEAKRSLVECPPFIFVTGWADSTEVNEVSPTALTIFPKPYDRLELMACVTGILKICR